MCFFFRRWSIYLISTFLKVVLLTFALQHKSQIVGLQRTAGKGYLLSLSPLLVIFFTEQKCFRSHSLICSWNFLSHFLALETHSESSCSYLYLETHPLHFLLDFSKFSVLNGKSLIHFKFVCIQWNIWTWFHSSADGYPALLALAPNVKQAVFPLLHVFYIINKNCVVIAVCAYFWVLWSLICVDFSFPLWLERIQKVALTH